MIGGGKTMYRNYDGWRLIIDPGFHPSFGLGLGGFGHSLDGFAHSFGGCYFNFCLNLRDLVD